jgi:hypothetical protein
MYIFLIEWLKLMQELNKHLVQVYQLFPPYNLGRGLANLAAFDLESLKGGDRDPYNWDVTGRSFALMLVEAVSFAILTLLIDADVLPEVCRFVRASICTPPTDDLSLHCSSKCRILPSFKQIILTIHLCILMR